MKKLSAVVNIATKGSVDRGSYNTFPSVTCASGTARRIATMTDSGSVFIKTTASTPVIMLFKQSIRIKSTARIRTIPNSTITNPSFFFKINGHRDVS